MAAQSQQQSPDGGRPIVRKTLPAYPDIARRMQLTGTVKLVALVAPNGDVKSVEILGGSPLLISATRDAVLKWKFAPASAESKESIELHFTPR